MGSFDDVLTATRSTGQQSKTRRSGAPRRAAVGTCLDSRISPRTARLVTATRRAGKERRSVTDDVHCARSLGRAPLDSTGTRRATQRLPHEKVIRTRKSTRLPDGGLDTEDSTSGVSIAGGLARRRATHPQLPVRAGGPSGDRLRVRRPHRPARCRCPGRSRRCCSTLTW